MDLTSTIATVLWALAVLCAHAKAQEDQREVPIIKQINRVNDDGTYTFGYEAADGSFKIETRDVLGNVKGMFGYVDERGELKRISYTANNGTGFQASGNIASTRRPVLIYRGPGSRSTTPRREDEDSPTTPTYGSYINARRGYVTTSTEEPTTKPLRVLVTKRPLDQPNSARNPNLIRRQSQSQSERDRDDYSRRFRYQTPSQQEQRELYRNQLLEQNNLKPEYSNANRGARYYPGVEEDYPELPPSGIPPGLERALPPGLGRALPPELERALAARLPPPVSPRYRPYDDQYYDRRYQAPFRRPMYDAYDYETFREAMNYLIQYLQYMRRTDPYQGFPYPGDYPVRPRLPIPPPGYPPRGPPAPPIPVPVPGSYNPYGPIPPGPLGYPAPNIPYINPNVQYSNQESAQTTAQTQLSNLKSRMDQADHSDNTDVRPPTSSLIRMLLARPSTQRPAIRSVEILGTSSSSTSTTTEPRLRSTTTTEQPDLMEASS